MDPFLGLGSSALAAAQLGVDFVGVEIDEHYLAEAIARTRAPRADVSFTAISCQLDQQSNFRLKAEATKAEATSAAPWHLCPARCTLFTSAAARCGDRPCYNRSSLPLVISVEPHGAPASMN